MGKNDILKIASYIKQSKYRSIWRKFVQSMACIVVFVTTYALILPAITIENQTFCGLEAHEHSESCYAEAVEKQLTCQLTEVFEHIHTDECYHVIGHSHTAECYDSDKNLVCGQKESPVVRDLSCTIPEIRSHTHEEACYDGEGSTVCGMEELIAHQHGDACYAVMTLQNPICGMEVHAHIDSCYSDLTADLETEEQWQAMVNGLELSENWAADLKTLARTQLGYRESEVNFISDDGVTKNGYTRYGAWYGAPYGKWDAMFVSFCLHYAGVPAEAVPYASNAELWHAQLQHFGYVKTFEAAVPEEGHVVFFKTDDAVHVGVISGIDGEGAIEQLRVIAGDMESCVAETNVTAEKVLGWIDLAAVQQEYDSKTVENEASGGEDIEHEEIVVEMVEQRAETENYIVTVTYRADLPIPEDAELRAVEYDKDSEIFRQRCEEAGYELEWLLNIGFFQGETELEMNGWFDVVVTAKQGGKMGTDVTHFAEDGTERIGGANVGDEQAAVGFASDGFSDYGGGIATYAAQSATLRLNMSGWGQTLPFAAGNTVYCNVGDTVIVKLSDDQCNYNPLHFTYSGCELVSATNSCNAGHYHTSGYWCTSHLVHTLTIRITSSNATISGDAGWLFENNSYSVVSGGGTGGDSGGGGTGGGTGGDSGGGESTDYPTYPYYPHAVHTGSVVINRLRFYNLCEGTNGGVTALAGCEFKITGTNYEHTLTSGDGMEVLLPPNIPDGTYTITQISAPAGYMRDIDYRRTFQIKNGILVSDKNIGMFINHEMGTTNPVKTAEVEDYNNRIYQILMQVDANMQIFEMDPVDVFFVVDQSNSMLFPATLESTGKSVQINANGNNNANNMEATGLDPNQVYYIISDPGGTATVFAIWYNGRGWMYQDASYYAKAKHENADGYLTEGETAIFPEYRSFADQKNTESNGQKSNGGGLGFEIGGSLSNYLNNLGGSANFEIYTSGNEYNRLHYVEEALCNMIYELADSNQDSSVTLVRFSKDTQSQNCMGPLRLTPQNADSLISSVTRINTTGGTRQDIALEYTYNNYLIPLGNGTLRYSGENNIVKYEGRTRTYVILVTDGAPALSSGSNITDLGTDTSPANNSTVYGNVKVQANLVRNGGGNGRFNGAILMTVALGMGEETSGAKLLRNIATEEKYFTEMQDAAKMVKEMQQLMFGGFNPKGEITISGSVYDEISDSFYPIAWTPRGQGAATERRVLLSDSTRDWVLPKAGDWITTEGRLTTASASNAAGQLLQKDDGTFCVQWKEAVISSGWNANLYVKAKEDFIGGNAIETNKTATVAAMGAETSFAIPTVNVRLLDMNSFGSEVTVYLGDQINASGSSPLDALREFYNSTTVQKLLSDGGNVLNQYDAASADGLEAASFYLRYALGRELTEQEWITLINGNTVAVEYTYDYDSSNGAVGQFIFRMEKDGIDGAKTNYMSHVAEVACQPNGQPVTDDCDRAAETYTLYITYKAYGLNESGRPAANANNGAGSPGTEVGKGTTLSTGLGTVTKQNVHEVHVISGSIELMKKFGKGQTAQEDRSFSFTLHRMEDGEGHPGITKTITIPAGSTEATASIVFDNLVRGTYYITEAADDTYSLASVTVLDTTNAYYDRYDSNNGRDVQFTMGTNLSGENVIGLQNSDDKYTSYVSPVNGVYAAAEFINTETIYEGHVHLEKYWSDDVYSHAGEAVYVLLLEDGVPITDNNGYAKLIRLDAANNWEGYFVVALDSETDTVSNHNYSIREVTNVSSTETAWNKARLENDGTTVLYYEAIVGAGEIVVVNGKPYWAHYTFNSDGTWTVENHKGVALPQTGGIGTHMYYFGGLLMIATALIYGFALRRKRERGRSD